jgi:hypothetical protein
MSLFDDVPTQYSESRQYSHSIPIRRQKVLSLSSEGDTRIATTEMSGIL